MIKKFSNPCSRCGKERILLRKWVEEIPTYNNKTTKVTRAINVCPDPECQKIVDVELSDAKRKRDKIKDEREKKQLEAANKKQLDKEDKEKLLESVV